MKYQMVERLRAQYSVQGLCRVLDVARSGYYAWTERQLSRRRSAISGCVRTTDWRAARRVRYGAPGLHYS